MKAKILYVDDDPNNLELFEMHFYRQFEILTALDGPRALKILESNPDIPIVFSDMKMPVMDGIEFIARAKKKYPDKQYYILTAYEITREIRDALNSGLIQKYFSKPFDIEALTKTIENALRKN